MVKIGCDWCRKDIKGRPDRYANHHFCLNDDCKNKYRRLIEGKMQLACKAVTVLETQPYFAATMHKLMIGLGMIGATAVLVLVGSARAEGYRGPPPKGWEGGFRFPYIICDTKNQIRAISEAGAKSNGALQRKFDELSQVKDDKDAPTCVVGPIKDVVVGESEDVFLGFARVEHEKKVTRSVQSTGGNRHAFERGGELIAEPFGHETFFDAVEMIGEGKRIALGDHAGWRIFAQLG